MKTITSAALVLFILFCSPLAVYSQSGCVALQSVEAPVPTGTGQPTVTGAVRVCTPTATGTPCSPLTANIYNDPALSSPQANPTTTDSYGNFGFCASPGNYLIQFTTDAGIVYSKFVQAASASASVSSVGLIMPGVLFSVSGSPVTGSGTITTSLINQTSDTVFGNCTGSSASPTFCALTAAMLPATVNSLTIDGTLTTASSGNTVIGGTLGVTGATTLTGALTANGAANLTSGGSLSGTFTGSPTISGNPTVSGALSVNTLSASSTVTGSQLISTVSTGTAPLSVSSTTVVPNLNVSELLGSTWVSPGTIGSTTPNTGKFTNLTATSEFVLNGSGSLTGIQGSDSNLMTAGIVSGTGAGLCTDGNGGATTTGCSILGISLIRYGSASGCSTTNSAGATCTVTVTWNSSFADTNYYPTCVGYGISGAPYIAGLTSISTGNIVVETSNGQGSQALISGYTTIYCSGVHP